MRQTCLLSILVLCLLAGPWNAIDQETAQGDYRYILCDTGAVLSGYSGDDAALTLPAQLGGQPLVAIGDAAFADNTQLTQIRLPDTVAAIGADAFRACTALQTIAIPETVAVIGAAAFAECLSLKALELTGPVRAIAPDTFRGCMRLRRLTLPDSLTSVADHAFDGCIRLEALHVRSADPDRFQRFCALFDTYQGYHAETGERGALLKPLPKINDHAVLPALLLTPDSCVLAPGSTVRLSVAPQPISRSVPPDIAWSSTAPEVALVYDGTVIAVRPGTCEIIASVPDGRHAVCQVRVVASPATTAPSTSGVPDRPTANRGTTWAVTDTPSAPPAATGPSSRPSFTTVDRTSAVPGETAGTAGSPAPTGDAAPLWPLGLATLSAAVLLIRRGTRRV